MMTANTTPAMTLEQQIEALKAENTALKASKARGLAFKVSEKGAVSVVGLGRFPVTLYEDQWNTFLAQDNIVALRAFIVAHADKLAKKPAKAGIATKIEDDSQSAA